MRHSTSVSKAGVFAAALLVAIGGLLYELILGTASSYLFGDSVTSFSLSIGTMLFGMGLGSVLASRLLTNAGSNFVLTEIVLSLLGGNAVLLLFSAFVHTKLYWLVFILLSTAIGILIGFEIPLMVRLARQTVKGGTEKLLTRVLALDYIGALAGSLLFPFILLPYLGLMRTAYAMGLLNALIALFILRKLDPSGRRRWIVWLNIGAITCLALSFGFATRIERSLNTARYSDPIVAYQQSRYQQIVLTSFRGDTRLYLNNQLQFSSVDEARYHETLVHAALSSTPSPRNILVLGGGDGLAAREILRYPSVRTVTIIDLDPAMTGLARSNRLLRDLNGSALADPRVHVSNQDAFTYLRQTEAKYDAIVTDLVDPSNEKLGKLYSLEFYQAAHRRLNTGGTFITQASSTYFTPNAFQTIRQSIRQASPASHTVMPLSVNVPSFGEWGFIMSVPTDTKPFSASPLPAGLSYVSLNTLSRAEILPADYLPTVSKDTVSTLLHPVIYSVYNTDMRRWRY